MELKEKIAKLRSDIDNAKSEKARLELRKEQLETELKDLEPKIQEKFGTLDYDKLMESKNELQAQIEAF